MASLRLFLICALALAAFGARALEDWESLDPVAGRPQALDFALPDVEAKVHCLSDYRGKTVLLNFWATWCEPCREEMPSLQRAADKLRDQGLIVLAVDVGEEEGSVANFGREYGTHFPILLDKESALMQPWGVQGLPVSFVVDPSGRIVYKAEGAREWDRPNMLDKLQAVLKER